MSKDEPNNDRVTCRTPTPGKQPVRIPAWKYDLVHRAITRVVPKRGAGVAFKDLPHLVADEIPESRAKDLGSIAWHTTTVKLDMEVKGELKRVDGVRTQHLLRA